MEAFLLNLLNGVGQINFQIVWKLVGLVFVAFWIVVLDWVWTDSGERTTNRRARIIYVLLVLFLNVLGWIIYVIIWQAQRIEQIYWADLDRRYLMNETAELGIVCDWRTAISWIHVLSQVWIRNKNEVPNMRCVHRER
jgi:hypothetical protein